MSDRSDPRSRNPDPSTGRARAALSKDPPPEDLRQGPASIEAGAALVADRLCWSTPDDVAILRDVSLSLGTERVGLVGRNGAGKSTLLRILAGARAPDSGSVRPAGVIHHVPQELPPPQGRVSDALGLAPLYESFAAIEAGSLDPRHYARLEGRWDFESLARARLAELGLSDLALDRPLGTLSGGRQRLIALAALELAGSLEGLIQAGEPILLLDEPTRHLDVDRRRDLLAWLERSSGPCLIVSHDAGVLDRVDRILELVGGRIVRYGGPRELFERRRAAERAARSADQAAAETAARRARRELQQSRERHARSAARGRRRRGDGSQPKVVHDARRARSEGTARRLGAAGRRREERLDQRLAEQVERCRERGELRALEALPMPELNLSPGRALLDLRGLELRRGTFRLTAEALRITGAGRVGLIGPNSAGKSTLLAALERVSRSDPAARGRGGESDAMVEGVDALSIEAARLHLPARVFRLDQQDLEESSQDSSAGGLTVEEAVAGRHQGLSPAAIAAVLGRLGYGRARRRRPFAALSGGERLFLRLAAGLIGDPPPQLLLLDEPNRDLDHEARERLIEAVADWPGALVLSSHDEAFLARLQLDQLWDIRGGAVSVRSVRE